MFCTKCGHQIEDNSQFCIYCGCPIGSKITQNTNIEKTAVEQIKPTKQAKPAPVKKEKPERPKKSKSAKVLAVIFGIVCLALIAVILLASLGIIDISINSLFNKDLSGNASADAIMDNEAQTPEPSESVLDEQALDEFKDMLCSGEWYSSETIDTDIEIEDWEYEDITPTWINVITFNPGGTFRQYSNA